MPRLLKASRDAVTVRALAFGTPDGSLWAAGLDAGVPALIAGGATSPVASTIDWTADGPEWTLRADGISLTVVPVPEPERGPGPDGAEPRETSSPPWEGRQELCRVTGTLPGIAVDTTGVRTVLERIRPGELGSVRGVSAWLSSEEAVTLLALRPRAESHHEDDLVAATVFDPDAWSPSLDPRLSTTYDGGGQPTRATLELWISDGERELPRRAAGEATGPAVRLAAEGRTLEVRPLRCHSRGDDGAGVYLLASV